MCVFEKKVGDVRECEWRMLMKDVRDMEVYRWKNASLQPMKRCMLS